MKGPYQDFLGKKGRSLSSLNIRGRALQRIDALDAVKVLRSLELPILGGDVYFERDGLIEPAYCNWHAEKLDEESFSDFVERSCEITQSYIERFPETIDRVSLFVFVTPSEP